MLGVGTTDPKCALREPVDAFRPIPRTPETARLVTEDDPELEAVARHAAANSEFNRADGIASVEEEKVVEQRALGFERRADGNYVMPLSGVIAEPEPEPTVLEAVNPRETSKRWRFLIADVSIHGESKSNGKASSATEKPVLVRDQDGTLRTATRAERKMHTRLFPAAKSVQRLPNQAARNLWEV